jgi:inhibitor of cysteine peptidase
VLEGVSRVKGRHASLLTAIAAVGALLALAGSGGPSAATADTITVGPAANGSKRTLHQGDLLVVRLRSNPSTGYSWRACSGVRPVLTPAGRTYLPPKDGPRVGAPGTAVLRFRAAASGKTLLRLAYGRSWETDVPPARTFELRVKVV